VGGVAGKGGVPGRLGLLGGTFDPPHYGHLVLAETARVQLGLDLVLLAPAGRPLLKAARPVASVEHRLALLEAAVGGNPHLVVSRVDIDRPGPSYTVDTLEQLGVDYPRTELYLLLGGDNLAKLLSWRDPAGIVKRARLAVLSRPGWEPDVDELERAVPGLRQRLVWLEGPSLDIQSSQLRRRAEKGLPLRYLVPPAVEEYVAEHGLYYTEERPE
jgi:nicotinate-nucleotide adenylyltransferase